MGSEAQRAVGIASSSFSLFFKLLGIKEVCEAETPQEALERCSHLLERKDVATIFIQASLDSKKLRAKATGLRPLLAVVPDNLMGLKEDPKRRYEELLRRSLGFKVELLK
ncbi:MAG: hypothetical protein QW065_05530 [Acidilobaceae archaeon]